MKRSNGFKRIVAFLTAIMVLVSCMCSISFADTETVTLAGDSVLTVSSLYPNRTFKLYQVFFGDMQKVSGSDSKTLVSIQWGASVKGYESELIAALKASTLADGTTNNIANLFANLSDNASAEDVATILIGISNDSDQADTFAQIVSNVLDGKDNVAIAEATTGTTAATAAGKYHAVFNNIHDGYYLIAPVVAAGSDSTAVSYSKFMLKVAGPSTVNTKNDEIPTLNKKIVKTTDDGAEFETRFTDAAIGDEVQFRLTSKVPNMSGYSKYFFVVKDELTAGLEFKGIDSITIGGEEIPSKDDVDTTTATKWYEVKTDTASSSDNSAFKIVFHNFIQYNTTAYTDADIVINYKAVVTEDAAIGKASDNINKAQLQFSNNPNYNYTGEDEPSDDDKNSGSVGSTEWAHAYVYTTGINIIKVDASDNTRLEGAQFKIEGTKLNTVILESDKYTAYGYQNYGDIPRIEGETYYYKKNDNSVVSTVPVAGDAEYVNYVKDYVRYTKLVDGAYAVAIDGAYYYDETTSEYVTELDDTHTYTKDFVLYTLDPDATSVVTKSTTEDVEYVGTVGTNGILEISGLGAGTYTITEIKAPTGYNILKSPITLTVTYNDPGDGRISDGCTWSYSVTDGTGSSQFDTLPATGILNLTISNSVGSTLPSTGGIGTTIFYTLGSALLIGAAVLLITKRRMSREEN